MALQLGRLHLGTAVCRRDAHPVQALRPPLRQRQAAEGGEAGAVDGDALAVVVQRRDRSVLHGRQDQAMRVRVVVTQEVEHAIGEHHAAAKGGIAGVLPDDADAVPRRPTLLQLGQVQPGRAGANDQDFHGQGGPFYTT